MITKEKMISLTNYKNKLEDSLKAPVTEKHKNSPKTYHDFLKNEIRLVTIKLEAAKLEGVK